MQTSLQGIANKAKKEKSHRFRNLTALLTEEYFQYCWRYLRKNAAVGADKVTAAEYGKHFSANIGNLREGLRTGSYRAKLVLRKWIPKGKDQLRPLGIPALEDKLLQLAVAFILRAIFEEEFLDCSHGYRPGRGAQQAALELKEAFQKGRYRYVVDADISGFFEHIKHDWLIRMLEQRIADKRFLRLIRKWLKAGILEEDGKVHHPETGTPQGGLVSPVLANVYLHYALDLWFEKVVKKQCRGQAHLCRYADDFVAAFEYKEDAERFYRALRARLEKFDLSLSTEKTKVLRFSRFEDRGNSRFDFLGFEYSWGESRQGKRIVKLRTSRKKFKQALLNFGNWCRSYRSTALVELLQTLNLKLRGYYNYYGVRGNYQSLQQFFCEALRLLKKWLNRRSQRKSYNNKRYWAMLKRHKIERPRIRERHTGQQRLEFS